MEWYFGFLWVLVMFSWSWRSNIILKRDGMNIIYIYSILYNLLINKNNAVPINFEQCSNSTEQGYHQK